MSRDHNPCSIVQVVFLTEAMQHKATCTDHKQQAR